MPMDGVISDWCAPPSRLRLIPDGVPQTIRGAATNAFLGQIRDLCAEHGIRHGTVRGLVRGKRIALSFSRDIPPTAQQQLRNWWGLSGWAAPAARS